MAYPLHSSQHAAILEDDGVYRVVKAAEFDYHIDSPLRAALNRLEHLQSRQCV